MIQMVLLCLCCSIQIIQYPAPVHLFILSLSQYFPLRFVSLCSTCSIRTLCLSCLLRILSFQILFMSLLSTFSLRSIPAERLSNHYFQVSQANM